MYKLYTSGKSTALLAGGKLTCHTYYDDNVEEIEEFDVNKKILTTKKWREKKSFGNYSPWLYEIGEGPANDTPSAIDLHPSNSNPIFLCTDDKDNWIFRVRNIPYPLETYKITIDNDKQEIVIRTTNKMFFKRFDIPYLKRYRVPLMEANLSFSHEHNTLIIKYAKPPSIIKIEQERFSYVMSIKQ